VTVLNSDIDNLTNKKASSEHLPSGQQLHSGEPVPSKVQDSVDMPSSSSLSDETLAVRAGFERSSFMEHAEPIFTSSSYVFKSAAEAAARFAGDEDGLIYSRFTNPTVQVFEKRLAALECSEACIATASGMAAINLLFMGTMKAGDHLVCTRNMFGSTVNQVKNLLPRFGIEVSWANSFEPEEWAGLITDKTRYLFLETPTNPLTEVADIRALSQVARSAGAKLVIDNCFCTPALQKPELLGADVIIHSATKFLDGQGRCVGGAVIGSQELIEELTSYMRSVGPCMSPFNAWVFLKGLETLSLRMHQHSRNANTLAHWLESHADIARVHYPGLESHPQHALAQQQQKAGGGIVAFDLKGGQQAAWKLIDNTQLCSVTANLGDTRTTITHNATTTHARMSAEDRKIAGVTEGLVRLSVGLEGVEDIQQDLDNAMRAS